jgi:hypothetical protein
MPTAIPYSNAGDKQWEMVILSGTQRIQTPFLNGVQRSVNRKVQGSSPCPGAKSDFKSGASPHAPTSPTTTAQQRKLSSVTSLIWLY